MELSFPLLIQVSCVIALTYRNPPDDHDDAYFFVLGQFPAYSGSKCRLNSILKISVLICQSRINDLRFCERRVKTNFNMYFLRSCLHTSLRFVQSLQMGSLCLQLISKFSVGEKCAVLICSSPAKNGSVNGTNLDFPTRLSTILSFALKQNHVGKSLQEKSSAKI